jgi:DNA-binding beta-propeller fold protein YncE
VVTVAGGAPGSADGVGTDAQFANPNGIAVDNAGNVFIADADGDRIRLLNNVTGNVVSIAGKSAVSGFANGIGTVARFYFPNNMFIRSDGRVYVADTTNHAIRVLRYV